MGLGRLISYTDTGAPNLQGTVGSLAALLNAVLVDGFGSVDPLGWTLEYSANSGATLAFRNSIDNGGTGFYFKVDDNYAANSRFAKAFAYEQMTSIDLYTNPILASEASPNWFFKSYYSTGQATRIPWWVIGDDKGFWLITQPQYHRATNGGIGAYSRAYIGDFNPAVPSSVYHFCLLFGNFVAGQASAPSYASPYDYITMDAPATVSSRARVMRGSSGAPGSINAGLGIGTQVYYTGVADRILGANFGTTDNDGPLNGVLYAVGPVLIHDGRVLLGTVPGWRDPIIYRFNTNNGAAPIFNVIDGDKRIFAVPVQYDSSSYRNYEAFISGVGFRDDI